MNMTSLIDFNKELNDISSYEFTPINVDEFLQERKYLLYGAGNLGSMAYDFLKKLKKDICNVVDKNALQLRKIKCVKPEETLQNIRSEYLWIICVSTISYRDIFESLKSLGVKHIIQFYTFAYIVNSKILSNGWFFKKREFDKNKAQEICSILEHDENSILHYLQFLWWKKGNVEKEYSGYPVASRCKYFKNKFMPRLLKDETYLDVGCYLGTYIDEFIFISHNEYKKIIAIDPDPVIRDRLFEKYKNNNRIEIHSIAISSQNGSSNFSSGMGYADKLDKDGETSVQVRTIDSLKIKPSVIKMHIEGEEYNSLCGARETIRATRPIIMVLADHTIDGYYKIPAFIKELSNYRLYFRCHDYCGNSAIFYFIPEERYGYDK